MSVVVIGHARIADVDILGLGSGFELEGDFREIRLLEQQLCAVKTLGCHVCGDVVHIYDAVDGFVFGHRFDMYVRLGVEPEFVAHDVFVLCNVIENASELILKFLLDFH